DLHSGGRDYSRNIDARLAQIHTQFNQNTPVLSRLGDLPGLQMKGLSQARRCWMRCSGMHLRFSWIFHVGDKIFEISSATLKSMCLG
ncbi:MAG: hypothetical protein M1368_02095, partial [Thaumarchaeota archaeon]|nr:hypothetical protein [Nitrososphaerota archaeon]